MSNETVHDDEAQIDTDDTYTDGDDLRWFIVAVNMTERTVTMQCHATPLRTIPLSDLENMERCTLRKPDGLDSSVVVTGFDGHYTDQDDLHWSVKAVNLRDRTVTVKLMNPPRRTISVEQLRKMRSMKRHSE